MPGNRNILFLIIGALVVVVGVLSYNLYQAKKQPDGLQINLGPNRENDLMSSLELHRRLVRYPHAVPYKDSQHRDRDAD